MFNKRKKKQVIENVTEANGDFDLLGDDLLDENRYLLYENGRMAELNYFRSQMHQELRDRSIRLKYDKKD